MTARDQEEQDARIQKLITETEKLRAEIRNDTKRIFWQMVAALGTAVAAGAAILGLALHLAGKL